MRLFRISRIRKIRFKAVFYISLFWTLTDYISIAYRDSFSTLPPIKNLAVRETIIFILSGIMGYIFVFKIKRIFRHLPLWLNFALKSLILILGASLVIFLVHFLNSILVEHRTAYTAYERIKDFVLYKDWMIQKLVYWMIIFFITQLFITINDKYAPGVFIDIVLGKYLTPKVEKRIVMFMDLKDSTPIAEKLENLPYFRFIREFIYLISAAIIEYEGQIYQYVGDEVVASWNFSTENTRKSVEAIIHARRNIQKRSEYFRSLYGVIPEFRVGLHVGDVTVGEIGVLKKDLAMSGDTMNTTARIRSACNELNHNFIVSKDFMESSNLKEWQSEKLGIIELKGKQAEIELFSLKI